MDRRCAALVLYDRKGALFHVRRRCPRKATERGEGEHWICGVHANAILSGRGVVWFMPHVAGEAAHSPNPGG